jgi:hypothetical protein
MRPVHTLVLPANQARARLFENHGSGKGLTGVEKLAKSSLDIDKIHRSDRRGAMRGRQPKALPDALPVDPAKDYLKLTPQELVEHFADHIAS